MNRFNNKTAFISGASKGIGFGIADRLASEGCNVFLSASNSERLDTARKKLETHGTSIYTCVSDLRTLQGCEHAAKAALDQCAGIDILVNCAGATKGGIFPQQPDEEMIDGFALKFHAAVRLSRLLWPALSQARGCVVNIVGGFARTPDADFMVGGAVNAAPWKFL